MEFLQIGAVDQARSAEAGRSYDLPPPLTGLVITHIEIYCGQKPPLFCQLIQLPRLFTVQAQRLFTNNMLSG